MLCFACKIYKISLRGFVGLGEKYPEERRTLGDHIRAARLERGLLQREVAEAIGVRCGTVNKWECNRCSTTWFRDILAQEIASGIAAYYNIH